MYKLLFIFFSLVDFFYFFLIKNEKKEMETELKLNWLAAGQIYFGEELVAFDAVPHMAVTYTELLLIAGARNHGIIALDMRTGALAFFHNEDRGETLGVLVDRSRVFVVTARCIRQYCLDNNNLRYMGDVARLEFSDCFSFTNAMTIDTQNQLIYARLGVENKYSIRAYSYYRRVTNELLVGIEDCLETITHIFVRSGEVYGVQGCVGRVCKLNDISKSVANIQGTICSLSASSDCFAMTQRGGHTVTLWTPEFRASAQYQIGLMNMFPEGQHAAVLLHKGRLITFHASHALVHLFEWRRATEEPSAALQTIFAHPKHARIDKTICRGMGPAEILSPDDIVDMMLNLDVEQDDFVAVDAPPAKAARTIIGEDEFPMVDPTYFDFLTLPETEQHFAQCLDDDAEVDYIGVFLRSEIPAL